MEALRPDVTTASTRPVSTGISGAPTGAAGAAQQVTTAGDIKQADFAKLASLPMGRPFLADILSQDENGASMVKVADTTIQMNLPQGAQVGDKVTLTLLATEPRLTFLYEKDPAAHSMVSNTGKLIDNILRSVSQDGSTATLTGRTPLMTTAADSPEASQVISSNLASSLESMLTHMFSKSGLFYESHLAQWVAGDRSKAEIMEEPQAKMQQPQEAKNDKAAQNVRPEDQMDKLERMQEKNWIQSLLSKTTTKIADPNQAQTKTPEPVVDQATAQMIRMQLDTMEQRKVIWQGEFWPGQPIEWEIEDDTPHKKHVMGEPGGSWQSVLRVQLPNLGDVTATMNLLGNNSVRVQINTADGETSSVLKQFGPSLTTALENAGAKLDYFTVNDETTTD